MKLKTLAIVALVCATACNNKVDTDRVAIRFKAGLAQYVTKATDTSFESGDAISLFAGSPINEVNAKLTANGSALTPAHTIYWGAGQTTASTFEAIYPYNQAYTSARVDFTVAADQSTSEGLKASDFMTASVSSAPSQGAVVLPFRHAMAKLVIKITNETDYAVSAVKMTEICQTLKADGSASNAGTVNACASGSDWQLIVAPQASSPKIVVSTTGGEYKFTGSVDIAAGSRGTIELTIKKDAPVKDEVSFTCTVSDWDEGATFSFTEVTDEGGEGGDSGDVKTLTISESALPTAYGDDTTITVDGISFYCNQTANYSNSVQIKKTVGYVANKTAFNRIHKITLTVASGKTLPAGNIQVFGGSAEKPESEIASDADGLVFDFSGTACSFFKLANTSANVANLASIEIEYE